MTVAGPSRDDVSDVCVALDIEDAGPSCDDVPPVPPVQSQIDVLPSASIDAYKLLKELEGATYRIGYLEAQLAERDVQIKLLTDSQHKPSQWARFKKWFLGQ